MDRGKGGVQRMGNYIHEYSRPENGHSGELPRDHEVARGILCLESTPFLRSQTGFSHFGHRTRRLWFSAVLTSPHTEDRFRSGDSSGVSRSNEKQQIHRRLGVAEAARAQLDANDPCRGVGESFPAIEVKSDR